jgi:hypothetical protein
VGDGEALGERLSPNLLVPHFCPADPPFPALRDENPWLSVPCSVAETVTQRSPAAKRAAVGRASHRPTATYLSAEPGPWLASRTLRRGASVGSALTRRHRCLRLWDGRKNMLSTSVYQYFASTVSRGAMARSRDAKIRPKRERKSEA